MNLKSYLLIIILFACPRLLMAQFNDTTHHHLTVAATGSINVTDNSRAYLLNNAAGFAIRRPDFSLNSTNSWVYGKQNSVLTNNDFSSAFNFNLYKTFTNFYYWGLVNYNTSYSLKINNQWLAGAGMAYSFIDKKNIFINLSDGAVYDQSDLLASYNYHTYRNSLRLEFHFANAIFTFDGTDFLQSAFSNGSDYIIRTTTTLGVKLRKWVSLTSSLTYNKMNITHSDNLVFTYGVTVDKYF